MSGIATPLVAMCELRSGHCPAVLAALATLDRQPSPFARVAGTHFARWAFVGRPPAHNGCPVDSGPGYLLMSADHDPPLPVWAHALCEQMGAELDTVMEHCTGWPGSGSPGAVAEFLAARNARPGFTVSTYGRTTVAEVRRALALRRGLRALAVDSAGLTPAELRARWNEAGRP